MPTIVGTFLYAAAIVAGVAVLGRLADAVMRPPQRITPPAQAKAEPKG